MTVPTVKEMVAAENKIYKEAIVVVYGFGMDAKAITVAAMKYLRGKGNPAPVYLLAKEYLENGHRFKDESP